MVECGNYERRKRNLRKAETAGSTKNEGKENI